MLPIVSMDYFAFASMKVVIIINPIALFQLNDALSYNLNTVTSFEIDYF